MWEAVKKSIMVVVWPRWTTERWSWDSAALFIVQTVNMIRRVGKHLQVGRLVLVVRRVGVVLAFSQLVKIITLKVSVHKLMPK